ncbi:mannose-6-phosphate isomerase, class I [Ligilactobacillus ceti]|uniref:Mannose-6-phosphate isomerase n=1 Tax=Ligilactobacillus ceti DSM 22408 TaxID=1122146 RepID=A0A0R2KR73_9LACO|nr:mannose-6-phosphate isomerase, class I [Ligilactobacillus ceti]KRN89018.1 mannose-6-phosphate isomerase [Ligilactobacillus ceti DSM 22408]
MVEPLFLEPYFQEKMWGGQKLQTEFNYQIPSKTTGECWAISAHKNGPAVVKNGPYKGCTLRELWDKEPSLFANQNHASEFPLLTKIIDAKQDLSVQVHPDDAYGLEHEGEFGKTECWYVLAAEPGAKIVYGHHAKTKAELENMIDQQEWDALLKTKEVHPGDFIYVPSGTLHAIGAGIMVLETQQSSDTTYRVYDYDRVDPKTHQLRDLHLQQSKDVTTVPDVEPVLDFKTTQIDQAQVTQLVENEFFVVEKVTNAKGRTNLMTTGPYTLVSVIAGQGELLIAQQRYPLTKGTHFILPNGIKEWSIQGEMELIVAYPNK